MPLIKEGETVTKEKFFPACQRCGTPSSFYYFDGFCNAILFYCENCGYVKSLVKKVKQSKRVKSNKKVKK